MRRAAIAVALLALAAGIALRLASHDQVFTAGTVLPLTADATYHLHRSLRTFASFPHAPVFDPWMNWPEGAYAHLADGYDVLSALVTWVAVPGGDELAAASVMVHVPIAFGVLTALLAAALGAVLASGHAWRGFIALASWVLALLLPMGIFVSVLGATDHHGAEAASVAALALWTLWRFPLAEFAARPRARRARFEAAGAIAMTAALYLWNAAQLYVGLAAAVLLAATLCHRAADRNASPRTPWLGSGAPALGAAAVLSAALYLPNARQHGAWLSYAFPSLLQPSVLLGLSAACCAAVVVSRRIAFAAGERLPTRRLAAAAALGAVAIAGLAAIPAVRVPVVAAVAEQLLRGSPWMQSIEEAQPLLSYRTALTSDGWSVALRYFGVFAPLAIALLPAAVLEIARGQRGRAAAFAWWSAALLGLSLIEQRFARPLWPLLSVWSAAGLAGLLRARVPAQRAHAAQAALLVLVLLPLLAADGQWLARFRARPADGQLASLFLSRANPVRSDGTRAGALAPWALGHSLMWPAKTGVVANGFLFHLGTDLLERSQTALAGSEAKAVAFMQERDLRWLVVGAGYYATGFAGRARVPALLAGPNGPTVNARYLALVPLAAAMIGGSGIPTAGVRHFEQLAPRWASPGADAGARGTLPGLWVYERVRGARLHGVAAPHAKLLAQLELRVRGRSVPLTAWTRSGPDGRFALRLAMWGGYHGDSVQSAPAWRLFSGARAWTVRVSERDVRESRTLDASDPAATPAALPAPPEEAAP